MRLILHCCYKHYVAVEYLDPVYTRTDPKWYGFILDPYQFLLAFTLDRIQISTSFTLGTELEQFHSNAWCERWM